MTTDGDHRGAPRVLLVCTGNLCRSPLAGALLERELARAGLPAEVVTGGLGAPVGASPDRKMQRVAAELGVDLAHHRSTAITREQVRRAELILTMTGDQTEQLGVLDPESRARSTTLRAAAFKARLVAGQRVPFDQWVRRLVADVPPAERAQVDAAYDIGDPMGGRLRDYRAMADEVQELVTVLVGSWSGR